MSLQVWLPLNGNLNNYGLNDLSQISPSQNTFTYNTSGKIGSCATGTCAWKLNEEILDNQWTVALWFKTTTAFGANNNVLFCKNTSGSTDCQIYFSIINGTSLHIGVNGPSSSLSQSFTFNLNTWYHVAATYDGNKACLYINGIFQTSTVVTTAKPDGRLNIRLNGRSANAANTSQTGQLSGYNFNDFRLYNHALSLKEVEEISKGLILHYKLDGNGKGNDNILTNTHFDNRYTQSSGWDTSKNGTLLANSWGGYNSGVSNQATVYHAHLKEFDGEYVYEYIKTANETWLGISQGGLQTKIVAGQTYTFSWEEYHVDGVNRVGTGLYYFKTGATSANFHLGVQSDTSVTRVIGQWQKYSYTFTAPSDADYNKNMSWYIYGHYNGNGTFYMRYPKLELSNSATSWTPNSNDKIYNLYNTSIIYDSSGYFNQGSIIGSIEFSKETPRYNTSTYIKSSDPTTNSATGEYYISGDISLIAPTAITISWWAKPENGYGGTINHAMWSTTVNGISSDYQVSAFNHRDAGFDVNSSDGVHLRLSTSSFTKNEWHHYAVVYDGQTAYLYKDGIQQTSTAFSASKTLGNFTKILIGHSRAGGVHRKMLGKYSDFRVYCTALTAEQIKELYNTSATIDNNGNVYAREVIE